MSGPFNVYWNFVYTGTPVSLTKKVNIRNFGSGLYSRMAVLPLCADAFEVIPLHRRSRQNLDVTDKLKEWAFKLDQALLRHQRGGTLHRDASLGGVAEVGNV